MTDYSTTGQRTVKAGLVGLLLIAGLITWGANIRAAIVCAPQAGKWLPWTGTVCYGENP